MSMEFQGKKATHDFLSLYNPPQDSRPLQGFNLNLKTQDFLKPLEKEAAEVGPAGVALVLPGGIGTCSISHVLGNGSAGAVISSGAGSEGKPEPGSGYGSYAGVASKGIHFDDCHDTDDC